jgi:hypothetical protein
VYQAIGFVIRERTDEHGMDEAEDRGVRTDTQRQDQDR